MKYRNLYEHLFALRAGFEQICSATLELGEDPSQEEIDATIERRTDLIAAIQRERNALNAIDPDWASAVENDMALQPILQSVEQTIKQISAMDQQMIDLLEERKRHNRRESSTVYHKSRAAGAYTVQARM